MPASETALALLFAVHTASADATAVERLPADPLRVAVYDLAPYGSVGPDGLFSGASADLWRRVAEEMRWRYQFTLVSRVDAILAGLEQDGFDAAIGAITITAERLGRVDFSYPAPGFLERSPFRARGYSDQRPVERLLQG